MGWQMLNDRSCYGSRHGSNLRGAIVLQLKTNSA